MAMPFYKAMRQCYRKSGFIEVKTAKKKINKIKYEGGPQMYFYTCTQCGRYHLTKNPEAQGQVF
jgi:uncharacterized protein CbrC (UPF0167 family)